MKISEIRQLRRNNPAEFFRLWAACDPCGFGMARIAESYDRGRSLAARVRKGMADRSEYDAFRIAHRRLTDELCRRYGIREDVSRFRLEA